MKKPGKVPDTQDEFGILFALWILASNDENPIITYAGIKYRLDLPEHYELEALVRKRGELFRRRVPPYRLEKWKARLRENPIRRPAWIQNKGDEALQLQALEALTVDDVFRSQFRAGEEAPRSSTEIIAWGLEHIERLRKSSQEAREEKIKSLQLWSVIILSLINIAVTILVAILK